MIQRMSESRVPTGLPREVSDRVAELYRDLEVELQPHEHLCKLSGVCCDFRVAKHTLFATELEVQYMLTHRSVDWEPEGELCPFWHDGLCHARRERPLGCRTYFCDPSWRDQGEALHERYHRALVRLAEEAGVRYRYSPWVARLRDASAALGAPAVSAGLPLDPPSDGT